MTKNHMKRNVFVLSERNSIANRFLAELRAVDVQQDRMRFRRNMERLGEILAYEVSRKIDYRPASTVTPLGEATTTLPVEEPVLISILRAGVPFLQGFINVFDKSDCGFVGAWRKEGQDAVATEIDYVSLPEVNKRAVILIDPMLATGGSVVDAAKVLSARGTPSHLYIVSVVAAPEGLDRVTAQVSLPFSLWTCAIDEKLDASYYIVPGLGDAGDLSYGRRHP